MSFRIRTAFFGLPISLITCAVFAQQAVSSPNSSPSRGTVPSRQSAPTAESPVADRSALTPRYRSTFEGYRPYADEGVTATSWREANDRVGRIGGWRAYAAEIQNEAAGAAASNSGASSAAPAGSAVGHEGHHTR